MKVIKKAQYKNKASDRHNIRVKCYLCEEPTSRDYFDNDVNDMALCRCCEKKIRLTKTKQRIK